LEFDTDREKGKTLIQGRFRGEEANQELGKAIPGTGRGNLRGKGEKEERGMQQYSREWTNLKDRAQVQINLSENRGGRKKKGAINGRNSAKNGPQPGFAARKNESKNQAREKGTSKKKKKRNRNIEQALEVRAGPWS